MSLNKQGVNFISRLEVFPVEVQKIRVEMNRIKNQLAYLEQCIKEIQQNCDHDFRGNQYYEKCIKCHKIDVLYY